MGRSDDSKECVYIRLLST